MAALVNRVPTDDDRVREALRQVTAQRERNRTAVPGPTEWLARRRTECDALCKSGNTWRLVTYQRASVTGTHTRN
jgi:hypothetical protein